MEIIMQNKTKILLIFVCTVTAVAAAVGFYHLGRLDGIKTAGDGAKHCTLTDAENKNDKTDETVFSDEGFVDVMDTQTFYAEIIDIYDDNYPYVYRVRGLKENDINYRSEFIFTLDGVVLKWRGVDISEDDLDLGDTISVTFTGPVAETYPGQIFDVLRIELLDDEK